MDYFLGEITRCLDGVGAIERILKSRCRPKMKAALHFYVEGFGVRLSCRAVGLRESRAKDLHRAAVRLGLRDLHDLRQEQRKALLISNKTKLLTDAMLAGEKKLSPLQAARVWSDSMDRGHRFETAW